MLAIRILKRYKLGFSRFAAVMIIFVGVGLNTHIDAMTAATRRVEKGEAPASPIRVRNDVYGFEVLSPKDADLYKAAFAAQASGDWATATEAVKLIQDRRLLGHVEADRYLRKGATLTELQVWLAANAPLPEAPSIYQMARALPDGKRTPLVLPVVNDVLAGGGVEASNGFRVGKHNFLPLWESGLTAWRRGDAVTAGELFAKLATQEGLSSWDMATAEFWTYRCLKRSGNTEQAYYWLRQAADHPRTFYGLLASELMGRDIEVSWQIPELNAARQSVLASTATGWRALALAQIGRADLAEAELNHLNPQGHKDLQQAMLALADVAHMASLSLKLSGVATNAYGKFYDAALYPVPPWKPAEGFQVDRALIYALMRHESQFDPQAVSERGACGLMQLMPATARLVAGKAAYGQGADCTSSLRDPSLNVAYGEHYVKRLSEEPLIGDNLLMLLTAYNSGPGHAIGWMNESVKRDPLLFIETLPVRQTRDYVQQVFIHYVMYRARLGQPVQAVKELTRGEWPRYAIHEGKPIPPATREAKVRTIKLASNDNLR